MEIASFAIPILKSMANICSPAASGRILKSDQNGRIYLLRRRGDRPSGVRLVSILSELKVGETGVVQALDLPESVQNHLMHMGFVPEARVTVLRRAPAGDPTVYAVDGLEIALRHETASAIHVREADDSAPSVALAQEPDAGSAEPELSIFEPASVSAPIELAEVAP